jgi:glycosyltransferase involved in cell wall biosynthesis
VRLPLAVVFHASGALETQFELSRRKPGLGRVVARARVPVLSLLERVALRGATRILVLSEYSKELVEARYPRLAARISVVSGGVDTDVFRPSDDRAADRASIGADADVPLLFTVRRLEPRMGLENLLDAAALLRTRMAFQLVIAGDGTLAAALRARCRELRLDDCVSFLGRVPDDTLPIWYRAADVFVLPTIAYEGFGLVTAEALASGTPVVGTNVGATPELLTPLDPELVAVSPGRADLASAIEYALARSDEAFRDHARRYACERFAWTHVVPGWERALAEVAA